MDLATRAIAIAEGIDAAGRERLCAALDAIDLDSDTELARATAYVRAARSDTAQK